MDFPAQKLSEAFAAAGWSIFVLQLNELPKPLYMWLLSRHTGYSNVTYYPHYSRSSRCPFLPRSQNWPLRRFLAWGFRLARLWLVAAGAESLGHGPRCFF